MNLRIQVSVTKNGSTKYASTTVENVAEQVVRDYAQAYNLEKIADSLIDELKSGEFNEETKNIVSETLSNA